MSISQDFLSCVYEKLANKGFGRKRADEIADYYKRRAATHEEAGIAPEDAAMRGITDTFNEMAYVAAERAKAARKNLAVVAVGKSRVEQAMTVRTNLFKSLFGMGQDSRGNALGHGLISELEQDPRYNGLNLGSTYRIKRGQYWSMMTDVLDNFSKGAFGRQLGAAHFPNILRESYGISTGDTAAAEIAKAYRKVQNYMVDDFNNAGGTLRKLVDFIMPQKTNPVKIGHSQEQWVANQLEWNDWNKVRWPDGSRFAVAERQAALEHVWRTLSTDGATDIDPKLGHGQGRALGNMLDKHRFLIYKDAESWLANHEAYGDGTVWDVVTSHIDAMAYNTALVTHWGQNPALMFETRVKQLRKAAGDVQVIGTGKDKQAVNDFNTIASRADQMMKTILHANPMNANSKAASAIVGASNLLTTALLGSASLIAAPSDIATAMAVRLSNHEPLIGGLNLYLKGVTTGYKDVQKLAAQSGYIYDEQIMSTFAAERFNGVSTYGPAVTRRISDVGMRLSGMNRHTSTWRFSTQHEIMGHLWRNIEQPFDKLDNRAVLEHYGISANEWDRVRTKIEPYVPQTGTEFFRPLDILKIKDADKEKLFQKFATMIDAESRDMVPAATLEASVALRGTTRPDTIRGALLHSFSMFKNYPITIFNQYGRRALAAPDLGSRVKFLAALGVGMMATGALGVQMREIARGREPIDMSYKNPAFWGKAVMASGGLSIWGDFLFGGNAQGSSFTQTAAGPLAGLASDMVDVTVGSTFKWIDAMDKGTPYSSDKAVSKGVEFLKRYNPLASNWAARLVLEREVFDQLQRYIDPIGARKRERGTMQRQKQSYGNSYYAPPGQRLF